MCAIYSSFLQRGYDQIVHDVVLQKLPVRFAMDRAGLVGADGATHSGFADVTYMGVLPNMIMMAVSPAAPHLALHVACPCSCSALWGIPFSTSGLSCFQCRSPALQTCHQCNLLLASLHHAAHEQLCLSF